MHELMVLLQIAKRNLFASFLNIVIGIIVLFGTFFFVLGSTILSNVDESMSRSIIGSVAGHIQVYSSNSKDELALFGNWATPDITPMPDFGAVEAELLKIDNIKAIVPMGINNAFLANGNTADQILERLRNKINKSLQGEGGTTLLAEIKSTKDHARHLVQMIQKNYETYKTLAADVEPRDSENLTKANSQAFWDSFDADPYAHLEFLENNIASLIPDADLILLAYVGTDLDAFQHSFDRMELVEGTLVPKGQRGMLLSKWVYEHLFKLKTALRLDKIKEGLGEGGKSIAYDPDLIQLVKQNRSQTREIILQLDPLSAQKVVANLQLFLNTKTDELAQLLDQFFTTDDANFHTRYDFFYEKIAPLLDLYRLRLGEMLTIKSYTRSGFVQAASVKVYGTFQFKGLEKSSLAGALSLMDMMTFRDLYGYLTPDRLAEMAELKAQVNAKVINRENAEEELFSNKTLVSEETSQKIKAIDSLKGVHEKDMMTKLAKRVYTEDEIKHGMALNAAVILKDPSKIAQTMSEIERRGKAAGLDLKTSTWQEAAGMVGKLVFFAKMVLYFAVFIIFFVALVIINNAVMMATLQRIREIGTMRAIGAQRSFVLAMVLIETVFIGLVFAAVGTGLALGVVHWLGVTGIPAKNEYLYFFFSGPRLYPQLGIASVIYAVMIVLIVTVLSALYPAIVATRVSPVQAMQSED